MPIPIPRSGFTLCLAGNARADLIGATCATRQPFALEVEKELKTRLIDLKRVGLRQLQETRRNPALGLEGLGPGFGWRSSRQIFSEKFAV